MLVGGCCKVGDGNWIFVAMNWLEIFESDQHPMLNCDALR